VAIRRWSQWPFQFPIQNVEKGAFWRNFGGFLDFLYKVSQRPFVPSLPLLINMLLMIMLCFWHTTIKSWTNDNCNKTIFVLLIVLYGTIITNWMLKIQIYNLFITPLIIALVCKFLQNTTTIIFTQQLLGLLWVMSLGVTLYPFWY
jgi:hypothetical protein